MLFHPTELAGAFVIDLERRGDERGFFARTFCEREFAEHGLPTRFPQCNLSQNDRAGTLRGMHYQAAPYGESKLVRVTRGAIYDVIVDLRPASATRLKWLGVELTADSGRALFVPTGFAHGFITLTDDAQVFYHMGEFYRPDGARGVRWNDPAFGIRWPREPLEMTERDASYPNFDASTFE
ncbi:MAG TPA: dTDP-4-dehydrorhamnose 3,5-epimerase, partial [Polyangiaceae bacterium]|nr:dTDP-4-dehydrorhamnose 3,5-epimerase [Polyangiaceae bacterium]